MPEVVATWPRSAAWTGDGGGPMRRIVTFYTPIAEPEQVDASCESGVAFAGGTAKLQAATSATTAAKARIHIVTRL